MSKISHCVRGRRYTCLLTANRGISPPCLKLSRRLPNIAPSTPHPLALPASCPHSLTSLYLIFAVPQDSSCCFTFPCPGHHAVSSAQNPSPPVCLANFHTTLPVSLLSVLGTPPIRYPSYWTLIIRTCALRDVQGMGFVERTLICVLLESGSNLESSLNLSEPQLL